MNSLQRSLVAVLAAGLLLFQGCHHHEEDGHSHDEATPGDSHAHVHENDTASYNKEQGLKLSPESLQVLQISHVTARIEDITVNIPLLLHVYASAPEVLAVTELPEDIALLAKAQPRLKGFAEERGTAVLLRDQEGDAGKRELVYRLVDLGKSLDAGNSFEASLPHGKTALLLPQSAVLDSATGPQVFLIEGDFFRRTEVKIGIQNEEQVEILSGIKEGDIVAGNAVEQLYLTELRLTKGGGHSH